MKKWRLDRKQLKIMYWIVFAIILMITAFFCFYKLDVKYVDQWDEARHGVNAYEMLREKSLIKSTYLYESDYYNLKPPLSMWSIMLSFMVFGTNVFALRFPSAFFYLLTVLACGLFAKKYGKLESLLVMSFLSVNTTAILSHMVRAGDADSLYVLLFTLAMLCMMQIPQKQSRLYLCGLLFSLAFLTKSFHAGVILIIGILFLILTGEIKKMNGKVWLKFIGITAAPLALWGIPRLVMDGSAFFIRMWEIDVVGRTGEDFGSHEARFQYYMDYFLGPLGVNLTGKISVYLCALVLCLIGAVYFSDLFKKENYRNITGYLLWIFVPFFAFSFVRSKLLWYMYPILVPLLLCAGIVVARLIKDARVSYIIKTVLSVSVAGLLLYYGNDILTQVNAQPGNEFQQLIRRVAAENDTEEAAAYVIYGEKEVDEEIILVDTWNQSDVFIAEAYGDFFCKQNGMERIADSQSADEGYLFIERDFYDSYLKDSLQEKDIICESENYMVFK